MKHIHTMHSKGKTHTNCCLDDVQIEGEKIFVKEEGLMRRKDTLIRIRTIFAD